MIYVICGENIIASRDYFLQKKKEYQEKNYLLIDLKPENIENISETEIFSPLFHQDKVFFGENFYQTVSKNKKLLEKIKKLFGDKTHLFLWEEKQKYQLSAYAAFQILEFKLEENIFTLLDNFYPGNKKKFLLLFHQLIDEKKSHLFFNLLIKRVRNLILIKKNLKTKGLSLWQTKKLKQQAAFWSSEKLIRCYQALFNVETDIKTSQTPYTINQLLDILVCYYL